MLKLLPNFQLIGHRGVAGLRPENTIASFQHAAELGLNWIELDARLTKCGQWIVIHDSDLARTTNGNGLVHLKTYREIANLEAGLWFTPPYYYEKIPTLNQALELASSLGLHINIEVKGTEFNLENNIIAFSNFLKGYLKNCNHQPLISSFHLPFLQALRANFPQLPLGYLVDKADNNILNIILQNKFTTLNLNFAAINKINIELYKKLNIPILVYTVNDHNLAKSCLAQGVTAIFTDYPNFIIENINNHN